MYNHSEYCYTYLLKSIDEMFLKSKTFKAQDET